MKSAPRTLLGQPWGALLLSIGLRCKLIVPAVMSMAILGAAIPESSQAHHPPAGTVSDHLEEDFVIHSRAKERRLERRTARITAPDVAVAQRRAPDDPGQVGQWGPVVDWPVVGVHVALLANGKVVAYDSVNESQTEPHNSTRATVWDPQTGIQTAATVTTGFNIFCSGLAHLTDGTLFAAGGNKNSLFDGIRQTHVFNQSSNTWSRGADMAGERWYPTVTPLKDGEMLITEGGPDVPEVRQTNGSMRSLSTASLDQPLYPWMDVAPDGRAFYSGPDDRMASLNPSGTGAWQMHGARDGANRDYGSHAMYDIGKILVAGGGNSLASARTINLNGASPQVSTTGSMATGRRQHNITVLADGTVLATGGNSSGAGLVDMNNGVYTAELWNPATGTWRTLASEQVTRQYHSTALLLPDGRVLSSGGGICGACDSQGYLAKNAQVFSPPYLFKKDGSGDLAARPTITSAPGTVSYNADFTIGTPAPSSIGNVAMIRLGAVTHSVNMEQRFVPLSFTAGGGNLTATAPLNANIAPPGYYMLFVIGTDGVPSVASMVRVENDPSSPAAPSLNDTDPDSPANDNNPEVKGSAEAGSTVRIYSTAGCTGLPLASGSAASFNGAGITTPVAGDQTTNLRATATDSANNTSPCSPALAYTEDSSAPGTPSLNDTDPDSPANDNNPEVKGSAEAGSTVRIYSTAGCTGSPLASGSAASFNGAGITTPVPGDQTTNLRATATDSANNTSGCSSALAYTEDSSAPGTPSLTDTDPDSPANDNNPEVKGSAEAGSTVRIYSTAGCTGSPLASGSAASFNGAGITTPVAGDQTTNLRATATDSANNTSGCSSALAYTEDSTAPQTQVDSGPQGPTNDATPSFGFSATGGAQGFECRFDSASFGPCSGPGDTHTASPLLSDGAHTFEVRATDSAQNTDQSPASRSFTVDTSPPAAPSLSDTDPNSPANDNNPEVKGSAEAGSTVRIYSTAGCTGSPLASGSAASFNGAGITTPVAGDQTTNLRATATDSANSTSGCSSALAYTEDSTAPQTQVDSGPQGPTNDATPSFGFSATGGAQGFECRFDSASFGPCSGPGDTHTASPLLSDGAHTFEVRATDSAQNTDQSPASRSFTVDTAAPQTQVDSGPQGPTSNNDPSFAFSSSESNSSFECRLDGPGAATGTFASCTSPRAFTDLADGTYTLQVRATDSVGNTDGSAATRSFTVDTSAPATPSLNDTDPDSPANDNNPEVKGSAEAGSTVRIYSTAGCTGSPLASGSAASFNGAGITTPVAGDQTTNLRATATDSVNNASGCSSALAYTEDSTAPNTSITSGPQGPTSNNDPSFAFSSSESNSSFECRLDGPGAATGTFASCTSPRAFTDLADGTYTFEVRATDSAQNTDQSPASRSFTVDTAAPQTQVDSGPQGPTNDPTPTFGFSATGGAQSYECRFDSASFGPCSGPGDTHTASPLLSDGAHTFEVRATDSAQNTDQSPASRSFTVDTAAPQTQVDSGPQGPTNDPTPTFGFSATGGAQSYECRFDSASFGPCSGPGDTHTASPLLSDGAHTFEVRATDSAQNTDQSPASRSFTVDTSPPAAPSLSDTDPNSPANDNNPEVKGSAEAGSTVKVYSSSDCSGSPLSSGTAGELDSPGLTVNVAADQTTSLHARASDRAGNESGCSAAIEYTEDSTPPDTELTDAPLPKAAKRKVKFAFSSTEAQSTFRCSLDKATMKHCKPPLTKRVARGTHVFRVYALDRSGNADSTPAKVKFKVIANR